MNIQFEKRLRDIFTDVYMKGYDQAKTKKQIPEFEWLKEAWKDAEILINDMCKNEN